MTAERSRKSMFRNLPLAVRQVILAFAGLSAGGVIAAGIFAFLVMIGIFPRLIGKTKTRKHILLPIMSSPKSLIFQAFL